LEALAPVLLVLLLPLFLLWRSTRRPATGVAKGKRILSDQSFSDLLAKHSDALARMRAAYMAAGGIVDAYTEPFLLRFLVGREENEEEATRSLVETTQWRKSTGAADARAKILAGTPLLKLHYAVREISLHFPILPSHGYARDGGPVSIFVHDGFHPPALMAKLTPEEYLHGVVAFFEYSMVQCDRLSASHDRLVKITNMFDFEHLTVAHLNLRFLTRYTQQFIRLDQHYPASFDALLCLNAPWLFTVGYKIARPWMSEQFVSKIDISVTKEESHQAAVSRVAKEQLPRHFGGTCDKMPKEVADRTGWSGIDERQRAALFGGYKLGGYYA